MSEKTKPSLQTDSLEQHLNLRLKERISFNNSFQNMKIIINFIIMKTKGINTKLKHKLKNCSMQSVDGILGLAVSANCTKFTISGVGLGVVPVASVIGADLFIFSKSVSEYLKRKEQHNLKKKTQAGTNSNDFWKQLSNCLEDNTIDHNEKTN